MFIAIASTMRSHSGYEFPFLPGAEEHDYHHEAFLYNYGSIGLCDWLHGTKGHRGMVKKGLGAVQENAKSKATKAD